MKKSDLIDILVKDYDYSEKNLNKKSKKDLEKIIKNQRQVKKGFFNNFWHIKGMEISESQSNDGIEGTQKYAIYLFIAWICLFIFLGLFMFLMIYFFA